jgi:hypothetical protein
MARGTIAFALTLGVLLFVSGYLFTSLTLMLGAGVDFGMDEREEFGEVGAGPFADGRCQSLWNHDSQFTS